MMRKDSFYKEPDVIVTMKCASCGETLLFGTEKCRYCGEPIEAEHATRSAILSTAINRSIALANTIKTSTLAMSIIILMMGILTYLLGVRFFLAIPLLLLITVCWAIIRWNYKYADVQIEDSEFTETKRKMKLLLNYWLAYVGIYAFILFSW